MDVRRYHSRPPGRGAHWTAPSTTGRRAFLRRKRARRAPRRSLWRPSGSRSPVWVLAAFQYRATVRAQRRRARATASGRPRAGSARLETLSRELGARNVAPRGAADGAGGGVFPTRRARSASASGSTGRARASPRAASATSGAFNDETLLFDLYGRVRKLARATEVSGAHPRHHRLEYLDPPGARERGRFRSCGASWPPAYLQPLEPPRPGALPGEPRASFGQATQKSRQGRRRCSASSRRTASQRARDRALLVCRCEVATRATSSAARGSRPRRWPPTSARVRIAETVPSTTPGRLPGRALLTTSAAAAISRVVRDGSGNAASSPRPRRAVARAAARAGGTARSAIPASRPTRTTSSIGLVRLGQIAVQRRASASTASTSCIVREGMVRAEALVRANPTDAMLARQLLMDPLRAQRPPGGRRGAGRGPASVQPQPKRRRGKGPRRPRRLPRNDHRAARLR
jgi:hypothetical protein